MDLEFHQFVLGSLEITIVLSILTGRRKRRFDQSKPDSRTKHVFDVQIQAFRHKMATLSNVGLLDYGQY